MKEHHHDYEAYYHPNVTPKARELGIKAVELRKCKLCDKELTFILTDTDWFPLFEYKEADEQDILLA
jgi:hypothetical protein